MSDNNFAPTARDATVFQTLALIHRSVHAAPTPEGSLFPRL